MHFYNQAMLHLLGTLVFAIHIQALAVNTPRSSPERRDTNFRDDFNTFDKSIWGCEYSCPIIDGGKARFNLYSGEQPDTTNTWCKARYLAQRFTSGAFSAYFSLTDRPSQAVWWGVALWDDGPAPDQSQANEINFGYTTDESFTNTEMLFESTRLGNGVSLKVDTGVDLYDEEYHNASIQYDSSEVSLYFDGNLLKTITDSSVIPTDAMDFLLGPRLVTGSDPLSSGFTESIDWVTISSP